jgi:hypothetical protein
MGLDTKTYWLTDRQSQCDFNFALSLVILETVADQQGRKRGSWGRYGIESIYQTTTGEDTADWEDWVRAVVNCRVFELAIALYLHVVTICKCSVCPITNPNPVYSHSYTWRFFFDWEVVAVMIWTSVRNIPVSNLESWLRFWGFSSFSSIKCRNIA